MIVNKSWKIMTYLTISFNTFLLINVAGYFVLLKFLLDTWYTNVFLKLKLHLALLANKLIFLLLISKFLRITKKKSF